MRRSRLTVLLCVLLVLSLLTGCAQNEGRRTGQREGSLPTLSEDEQAFPWDPAEPSEEPPEETPSADPGEENPEMTEPSETEEPTEPAVPTGPADPTEPTKPDLPGVPTEPEDPVLPTDPEEPTEPVVEEPPADGLEQLLSEKLAGLPGTWSVYVKNLSTGETVSINDEPLKAASLIKLYVAGAYYSTDPAAADAARCGQVDTMISTSSNEACNTLIKLLGMEEINAFIRSQGDNRSVLNRKMLEQNGKENYITTRDCGRILEQILAGTYVSPAASERLLQNLKDQARTGKIPAGVPRGVQTANKTGELADTENDAAIVWSPGGTYILCVMSTDLGSTASARQSIVDISKLVYAYFNAG